MANLTLARASTPEREIAVRLAVSGSRWQIVHLSLSESLLIALIGGTLGMLLAFWAVEAFKAVGAEVRNVKKGDFVVMPLANSDGTCPFCYEGLDTPCVHRGFFSIGGEAGGAQAEVVRVPLADGTLFVLPSARTTQ